MEEILITCHDCKKEKPSSRFNKDRRYKSGFNSWCKDCRSEYAKKKRLEDKLLSAEESIYSREYARQKKLEAKHNMPYEDYEEFTSQPCEICGTEDRPRRIDHLHGICDGVTTRHHSCEECRRGPLCDYCNTVIGYVSENVDILQSAILYLQKYGGL